MKILIINGVNLDMTGKREAVYGTETLEQINARLKKKAETLGLDVEFYQSNSEGEIVDRIHRGDYDGLIINPGAYTHYSYAIADALSPVKVKKIEVHMTNIHAREDFRHNTVTGACCDGVIAGLGSDGYSLALEYFAWKK